MVTNEKIIMINRPIDEVFAYIGDLENGPKWQKALLEAWRIDGGPLGTGSKFSSVRKFMGRKLASIVQFTTYELNKKIAFTSISGSSPFKQSFLFEPTAEGTKLTTRLELQTGGLMGLAEPLIASGLKREVDKSFGVLKEMLERKVSVTSA
jgi:uncharacterized membrane protein